PISPVIPTVPRGPPLPRTPYDASGALPLCAL
ncbi:hypothetical protein STRIP9103_06216, partial [Streptomyces ipomoeae 91-03]